MRSQLHVQETPRIFGHHLTRFSRGCQLLALLAVVCCLVGTPSIARNTLWAQPPLPPEEPMPPEEEEPMPPMPPEEAESAPEFIDFDAVPYPGEDNWLVFGQIAGCNHPENIEVEIDIEGESAGATTDFFGYFEVLVNFGGLESQLTADADYEGSPIPTAFGTIGT